MREWVEKERTDLSGYSQPLATIFDHPEADGRTRSTESSTQRLQRYLSVEGRVIVKVYGDDTHEGVVGGLC